MNKMLAIYTHSTSLSSKEFWKWAARRILRKYSGPNAVEESLLRGLRELKVPFTRNKSTNNADIALVLSGTKALREAITLKKSRRVTKLIAGPNVVTHPKDFDELIFDPSIDKILVPSLWVKDFWCHEAPELSNKLVVWPSGVATNKASTRTGKPIIYDKLGNPSLLAEVQQQLETEPGVFTYGSLKRKAYLEALDDAPFLIYLSKSESQGLALQEAWAHDVPTLVNKSNFWSNGKFSWEASQINCPYLTSETGIVFGSAAELPEMITRVSALHPKDYCNEHLSDRASAEALLEIL